LTTLIISIVTKADIIAEIAHRTATDKFDVQNIVEEFFNVVKDNMAEGENIYVRGFGSFVNKKRARKVARNISKKQPMVIEPHYVPSFKPAKTFLDAVKNSQKLLADIREEEQVKSKATTTKAQKAEKENAATMGASAC